MQTDTQKIKERLSIIDIIGSYVRLSRAGTHWKAQCPFHNEKTPSFTVNEERQSYHCFGCGKGGDIFSFLMEMDTLSFPEALRLLAERAGVEIESYTPEQKVVQDRRGRLGEMLMLARTFYEKQLWTGDIKARTYLLDRGMTEDALKNFHIGFAPEGWNHLEKFLTSQGYIVQDLIEGGMSIAKKGDSKQGVYDRFRARIMFPIHDPLGRVIGFSARALPGDDESAKYINTPETPLYHKSSVLYGIEQAKNAIKKEDAVILVEGNMDVIALHQAGYENVVAVSGTAMTQKHITVLKRYTDHFILFFDADIAGQKAARKSAEICLASDVSLTFVQLSDGKDAADLVASGDAEMITQTIMGAQKALDFFTSKAEKGRTLSDPHDKRIIIDDILSLAACVAHPVERNAWVQAVVERYDITESVAQEVIAGHAQVKKSTQPQPKLVEKKETPSADQEQPPQETATLAAQAYTAIIMSLSYMEAWKILASQKEILQFLAQDDLLKALLSDGEKYGFDPDKLIAQSMSNERYNEIARYRSEHDAAHAEEDMRRHITLMRRTYLMQKHTQYIGHIDALRKKGDREKQKIYEQKVHTIQNEMENLIE